MAESGKWFAADVATFGDRLAGAREAAGLTQEDMAQRLGVRLTTVQAWEEDMAELRGNRLQMLAGMLNVSLTCSLDGRGRMTAASTAATAPAATAPARVQNAALVASQPAEPEPVTASRCSK